ncbi:MAG: hypothetical protein ACREKL_09790, partial [Chthoniobacterales bacterium]
MHAPSNWEIEQPGSTSIEVFGLQQALRFLINNFFLLAGGVVLGLIAGLVLQKITPTAYVANGKFVVGELPFSK